MLEAGLSLLGGSAVALFWTGGSASPELPRASRGAGGSGRCCPAVPGHGEHVGAEEEQVWESLCGSPLLEKPLLCLALSEQPEPGPGPAGPRAGAGVVCRNRQCLQQGGVCLWGTSQGLQLGAGGVRGSRGTGVCRTPVVSHISIWAAHLHKSTLQVSPLPVSHRFLPPWSWFV